MHLSGVIITDESGKILLLHRATVKRTQWEIPGGKIEAGEDAMQAAVREVGEELRLDVKITREIGSESFSEDGYDYLYTWFLGVPVNGSEPVIGEPERFDRLQYWSPADLAETSESISANTKNFVKSLQAGRIFL